MMKMKHIFRQVTQSLSVALFIGFPVAGWSATVSDRPLFIDAVVDHNVMFAVDDSGSMDFEVLAPAVGGYSSVVDGWLFNPSYGTGYYKSDTERPYYRGLRLSNTGESFISFSKRNFYLRSNDYNSQYYDPSEEYKPWPGYNTTEFSNQSITAAKLDPGLTNSLSANLTSSGELGLGSGNIPATLFLKIDEGEIVSQIEEREYLACPNGDVPNPNDPSECGELTTSEECTLRLPFVGCVSWREVQDFEKRSDRAFNARNTELTVLDCSDLDGVNMYSSWRSSGDDSAWVLKKSGGIEIESRKIAFAPDGACLQRLEFKDVGNNKDEIYEALNGVGSVNDFFTRQQVNFANWFSYSRRRHQVIRSAIAQSVLGLEDLNMGIFWFHNRRDMSGKLYNTEAEGKIDTFLSEHYSRFGGGEWKGGATPTREALQHAGKEYGKAEVRKTLECRRNFTLLFTDGYANKPSITIDAANADSEADAPFANSYSGTLGDIAYYYGQALWEGGKKVTGGRLRLPEECSIANLKKPWMDCNEEIHMNTYAVALGIEGQKFAGKGYEKVIDAHLNPPTWNEAAMGFGSSSDKSAQIDDLYHSAVNGKGEYYNAKSSAALVKALQSAMDDIGAQLGSGSNVSFNTTSLRSGGYIYSAQFTSKIWTGTLRAEAIDKNGVITSRKWDAAPLLDARDLTKKPRRIITFNGGGVDFEWDELSNTQQLDLKAGGSAELGIKRISYLRGNDDDTIAEGGGFRDRGSRLGAIINSSPVYVGEPNKIWPDDSRFGKTAYSTYKSSNKSRTDVVYVGANDGMLHGFDAQTGEEVIAYIPDFLYSTEVQKGLSALTVPDLDYQSYVDLPLNTSDVYVNDAWRSIVIGGSRGGKPGLFALDVTDPSIFASGDASAITMWEFTDENLGNMTDAVQIVLLKWGEGDYRWSAVFSNGYDAPSEQSGLFILDIANPTEHKRFISLGEGKGLSSVRLVDHLDGDGNPNSDGIADRAYAGDLDGNLWVFDLTGGSESWTKADSFNSLFIAKDADGVVQPITAQPDIARNSFDSTLTDPNLLVFFGTGKYLEAADIPQKEDASDAKSQTFYGISDRGKNVNASGIALGRGDLVERTFTGGLIDVVGEDKKVPVRKTDGKALEDWSKEFGWYVDLPGGGERVVEPPRVRGEYIVFSSTIPTGGDPCGGGGSSFLTALQLDGSTDSTKAIIDVNNDGELKEEDEGWAGVYYGKGIITSFALIDNLVLTSDSGARKSTYLTNFGGGQNAAGRIGWTELVDF